jgi:colanic acid/amylovoran biosynthesis protein
LNILITHSWSEENTGDYAIEKAIKKVCQDITQTDNQYIYWSNFDRVDNRIQKHNKFKLKDKDVSLEPSLFGTPPFQYGKYKRLYYVVSKFLINSLLIIILFMQRLFLNKIVYLPKNLYFLKEVDFAMVKGGTFLYAPVGIKGAIFSFRIALPIIVLNLLDIKYIVAPHSLGPFNGSAGTWILKKVLKKAKVILCREEVTVEDLKKIGLTNTEYCPDMAFYLGKKFLETDNVKNDNFSIGITVRPWKFLGLKSSDDIYERYLNEFASALVQLSKDFDNKIKFYFVPQVIGPDAREDDRLAISDMVDRLKNSLVNYEVIDIKNREPENLISIYSKFDMIIGTRMHSIILSFLTGKPAIAIAYLGPKHIGIMKKYGLEEYVTSMQEVNSDFVVKKVKKIYENLDKYQKDIRKNTIENILIIEEAFKIQFNGK